MPRRQGRADRNEHGGARRYSWRRSTDQAPPPADPPTEPANTPPPQDQDTVVNAALYRDGVRVATPETLTDTYRQLREKPRTMAWIGLARPSDSELKSLAAEFDLHDLAVEDALEAHQRPKLERYGETLFVVLRAARYLDAQEEVDFGELHVFVGPDFVITVRHGAAPDLSAVRRRMEATPSCSGSARRRSSTPSWTRSSTATRRWCPASRTTSTRSRRRSSPAPPPSRAASTNSPGKWSSSSARPAPWSACCTP